MATYNSLYVLTRFSSVSNASRKNPKEKFIGIDNRVYRKIWCGAMRGKIKNFILEHKIEESHHGENWNGYGYQDKYNDYFVSLADGKKFLCMIENKKTMEKPAKTWEQVRDTWARRLVRLLSCEHGYEWITLSIAQDIAEEKNDYKFQQIEKVEERQHERYSPRRASLIRKMERENPLRRIENVDHAKAIIQASNRHNNSNYDSLLERYHADAEWGLIDRADVREKARLNMQYTQK